MFCHAPRCTLPVLSGRKHCGEHLDVVRKTCTAYQRLKPKVEKCLSLGIPRDVSVLLHIHSICNTMFCARLRHAQYAYRTEFWDDGHQTQLRILRKRIEQCEQLLGAIFTEETKKRIAHVEKIETDKEIENDVEVKTKTETINRAEESQNAIRSWKKIRELEEEKTNKIFEEFEERVAQEKQDMQQTECELMDLFAEFGVKHSEDRLHILHGALYWLSFYFHDYCELRYLRDSGSQEKRTEVYYKEHECIDCAPCRRRWLNSLYQEKEHSFKHFREILEQFPSIFRSWDFTSNQLIIVTLGKGIRVFTTPDKPEISVEEQVEEVLQKHNISNYYIHELVDRESCRENRIEEKKQERQFDEFIRRLDREKLSSKEREQRIKLYNAMN